MTNLSKGREALMSHYTPEECPDKSFREKMSSQIMTITTGVNAHLVWLNLPIEDKQKYKSIEDHPKGTELCLKRWAETGADKVWGDEYG